MSKNTEDYQQDVAIEGLYGFGDAGVPRFFDTLTIKGRIMLSDEIDETEEADLIEGYELVVKNSEKNREFTLVETSELTDISHLLGHVISAHFHGERKNIPFGEDAKSRLLVTDAADPETHHENNEIQIIPNTRNDRVAIALKLSSANGTGGNRKDLGTLDFTLLDQTGRNFVQAANEFFDRIKEIKEEFTSENRSAPGFP